MKPVVMILLACGLLPLAAQETRPSATDAVTAFAIAPPDENSPFFLDPVAANSTRNADFAGRDLQDVIAGYPKNRNSPDSASSRIKKFFTGIFSSVSIGPLRTPPTTEDLKVDPSTFPLQDRHELNVTYSIRNNTKKMTRLEYPTTQHMDIVTTDSKGAVVDRWSDDRSFQPEEGIVVINPKERIEYQEKIPTREMKAKETYKVQAFTTSQEKFTTEKTVNPE
ncbi:MAG: hypothetical protein D4R65_11090 [Verrucomicrobiaceae bacterium]|nr:MAG: hypothetical protein D4R65_11090 [Verrucomicrobiaceae bacterium]